MTSVFRFFAKLFEPPAPAPAEFEAKALDGHWASGQRVNPRLDYPVFAPRNW